MLSPRQVPQTTLQWSNMNFCHFWDVQYPCAFHCPQAAYVSLPHSDEKGATTISTCWTFSVCLFVRLFVFTLYIGFIVLIPSEEPLARKMNISPATLPEMQLPTLEWAARSHSFCYCPRLSRSRYRNRFITSRQLFFLQGDEESTIEALNLPHRLFPMLRWSSPGVGLLYEKVVDAHLLKHFNVDTVPLGGSGVSEANIRDKIKPWLQNARFRFWILPALVPFRGQKCLNHTSFSTY